MKLLKFLFIIAMTSNLHASGICEKELRNEDTVGGGISSVGGGGDGFAIHSYLNSVYKATFPQLILLKLDKNGKDHACVYDQHFGQTKNPKLLFKMNCTASDTDWPYTSDYRVKCQGSNGSDNYYFEATYLSPNLIASFRRKTKGVWNTHALAFGH